jgi:hypothetical protein
VLLPHLLSSTPARRPTENTFSSSSVPPSLLIAAIEAAVRGLRRARKASAALDTASRQLKRLFRWWPDRYDDNIDLVLMLAAAVVSGKG